MAYNSRLGVKNNPTEYFPTPIDIRDRLLSLHELDYSNLTVFDPCAGSGELTRGLKAKKIIKWDLEPRADDVERHNALEEDWPEADVLVCNPPFTLTKQFRQKAKHYKHQFWITTYGRAKNWKVDRFVTNITFGKVITKVCLIYISKSLNKRYIDPPVDSVYGLSLPVWMGFFRDILKGEAFQTTPEQAEKIQDEFFVTKALIGSLSSFQREWKDVKGDILKKYDSVQDWIDEKPTCHKLYATRKTFYDKTFSIQGKEPKTFLELYAVFRSLCKKPIFFYFGDFVKRGKTWQE